MYTQKNLCIPLCTLSAHNTAMYTFPLTIPLCTSHIFKNHFRKLSMFSIQYLCFKLDLSILIVLTPPSKYQKYGIYFGPKSVHSGTIKNFYIWKYRSKPFRILSNLHPYQATLMFYDALIHKIIRPRKKK